MNLSITTQSRHLKLFSTKSNYLLPMLLALLLAGCQAEQTSNPSNQNSSLEAQQSNQSGLSDQTIQSKQNNITQKSSGENTFTILALGDSLTEGLGVKQDSNYPALLQKSLHQQGYQQIKVINSGLSGETSSGLKSRVDWVLQLEPDLTILNIGANDAMRGLPLKLTTDNINEIIARIQATGSDVVLAGMQIYDNLGKEYVVGFKDMYPKIAKQNDLVMIPFFLDHVAGMPELNQADMIHPTSEGYQVIVERNILPTILPIIKDLPQTNTQTP